MRLTLLQRPAAVRGRTPVLVMVYGWNGSGPAALAQGTACTTPVETARKEEAAHNVIESIEVIANKADPGRSLVAVTVE